MRHPNNVPAHRFAIGNITAAVLAGVLFAGCLSAQLFKANTRLVVLHATVTDHKGRFVSNLTKKQFQVYENGKLQKIKLFLHEDAPVSLGLIIDDSGSMESKRSRVEAASLAMVRQSNRDDEVFVVNFNDDAYLDVPFTNSIPRMRQGLARIDARGGTAMRDAISMSLDYMREKAKQNKRVLMVITDGNDNASTITLERLVEKANQYDTLVYAIGLFGDEEKHEAHKARRALNELTRATGGLAFYPRSVSQVKVLAVKIAHDIRNQYTIAYSPDIQKLDGSYRQIKVVVDAKGHPHVRTRAGYYATPEILKNNRQTAENRTRQP
ncbi:MAG TPA: VWA domain-containing protein [Bryobacteraceae bacterium]